MAQQIDSVDELQQYLTGVAQRAEHHAPAVSGAILALAGAIVLFKDRDSAIQVGTYRGRTANVARVAINGRRLALSYDHDGHVKVHDGSLHGEVLIRFDNNTPTAQIAAFFTGLRE